MASARTATRRSFGVHAPYPTVPVRQYSFTDNSVNNPTSQQPGDRMDSEYDRTNASIAQIITWAGESLNTDGTLGTGTVGAPQLAPGIFDFIAEDAIAQVQPLVDDAQGYAGAALNSSNAAATSANQAGIYSNFCQDASRIAVNAMNNASASATLADNFAVSAIDAAAEAGNSQNHAAGSEATCEAYGLVTQAWAEHMPDTIPPNILAVMGVTGDHWSSRWWANRANQIVGEAKCEIQQYWMGAWTFNPVTDDCGRPVRAGAAYFNLVVLRTRVFDGQQWHDIIEPVPGFITDYVFLPTTPTARFTGLDANGRNLTIVAGQDNVAVFLNGVRMVSNIDAAVLADDEVTLLLGTVTAPSVVEITVQQRVPPTIPAVGNKVDTTPWVLNSVNRTFPLADGVGNALAPAASTDCFVSIDGVIQEPGIDFSVAASTVTFTTAPDPDTTIWMLCGIAVGGTGTASSTIFHTPIPPPAPPVNALWSRTDGCLFIYDGVLNVWIQLSGYAA